MIKYQLLRWQCAGVAELADALDLKSNDTRVSYRFDPGHRHPAGNRRRWPSRWQSNHRRPSRQRPSCCRTSLHRQLSGRPPPHSHRHPHSRRHLEIQGTVGDHRPLLRLRCFVGAYSRILHTGGYSFSRNSGTSRGSGGIRCTGDCRYTVGCCRCRCREREAGLRRNGRDIRPGIPAGGG